MTISKRALLFPAFLTVFFLTACQQSDAPQNTTDETNTDTDNSAVMAEDAGAASMAEAETGMAGDDECELVMGWDPWEPYHFEGSDGETRGIDVEIAEAMAQGAGCELTFQKGEWAVLLRDLQAGDIDILAGATKIEERESYAWFSEPYRSESFNLHVVADYEMNGDSLTQLVTDGFRLGLTEGYIYGPKITAIQDAPVLSQQIVYSPIAEYHFNNLAEGRIDGFLEDPYVAEAISRRHGWTEQVKSLDIAFGGHDVRFMFSRASVDEALAEKLSESLQTMEEKGTTDGIMRRYQHQGP